MAYHKQNKDYEKWLNIIESQLKVFNYVSCQKIFIYLRIYGKKTAADLMDALNYSRGAIYTALNLLQEAQYIKKEEDPDIEDKRKNVFFYAIDKDFLIVDDKKFLDYVIAHDKVDSYLKWLKNSVKMSTSMIDVTYQFAITSKIEKIKQLKLSDQDDSLLEPVTNQSIITFSELGSITNQKEIVARILNFVKKLEKDFKISKSSKNPINNPTLISLFYIPLR
ncbi:MAG: hypothetical protein ACFFAE_07645 [Candidatus Hodarchaeota archaeon]